MTTKPRVYHPRARCNVTLLPYGDGSGPDHLLRVGGVVPTDLTVDCRPTDEADKFDAEFDVDIFPLEPKSIRAMVVDVHLGDVEGMGEVLEATGHDTRLILGHADKTQMQFDPESATLSVKGRDYAGLLLDLEWRDREFDLGRPVSDIIADVIFDFPSTSNLRVEVWTPGGDTPTAETGPGPKGDVLTADVDAKVWDVLHEFVKPYGLILTVVHDAVVIQPPRNVGPPGADPVRLFIDGHNLTDLTVTKGFVHDDMPNVLVTAIDPNTFERVEATYPDDPIQTERIRQSDGSAEKSIDRTFKQFTVNHPNPTVDVLREVAKRIYEGRQQQQLEVEFTTADMSAPAVVDGERRALPVAPVRNGTPIRCVVDRRDRNVLDAPVSPQRREYVLRQRGFRDDVAEVLARDWRQLDRRLFVDQCQHQFSAEDGYELSIDAVNFIEV